MEEIIDIRLNVILVEEVTMMDKKYVSNIILFAMLISYLILNKLGFTLLSRIISGMLIIVFFIISLPNFKAMNKKLLATIVGINLVPFLVFVYALIFQNDNSYWLWGSTICFLISFPISFIVIYFYKKKHIE
jgi:hypothetical protein